jgi:hypothetical protein
MIVAKTFEKETTCERKAKDGLYSQMAECTRGKLAGTHHI